MKWFEIFIKITLKSNSAVILNKVYDYKDVSTTKTTNFIEAIRLSNNNGYSKSLTYAYDANGNITNANGVTYVYDEAGQLVRVNDPNNGTTTFQYDKGGNLVYEKTYAYTTGALGNVTSTKQYSYQYDRLVSVTENGVTTNITYDVSGNPLTYHNGMSFQWEMGRQLAGITNGSTTISYTYNEDGIRTSKTVNGVTTEYTLVDGRITYQTDGNTSMYFRYDGNDELIGFEYTVNGVTNEYYYVKNLQGDIIDILDNTGYVAANVIGAVIAGVIGAVGGAFLGKWLADRLKITDFWKRAAFIGAVGLLVGVTAAAIGYFIGPYVAKAWSV